jgi:hypothetical protein
VALQTAGKTAVAGTVAKGAATAVVGKSAAGTLWAGTGMSLGLGLGLGAMGPVLLGGAAAAAGYGIYRYLKNRAGATPEVDAEIADAMKA